MHTVRVYDASSVRKTADHFYKLLVEVKEHLECDWGVNVVAITSDASGESRKGRTMAHNANPSLVVPDCYAHQARVYFVTVATIIDIFEGQPYCW